MGTLCFLNLNYISPKNKCNLGSECVGFQTELGLIAGFQSRNCRQLTYFCYAHSWIGLEQQRWNLRLLVHESATCMWKQGWKQTPIWFGHRWFLNRELYVQLHRLHHSNYPTPELPNPNLKEKWDPVEVKLFTSTHQGHQIIVQAPELQIPSEIYVFILVAAKNYLANCELCPSVFQSQLPRCPTYRINILLLYNSILSEQFIILYLFNKSLYIYIIIIDHFFDFICWISYISWKGGKNQNPKKSGKSNQSWQIHPTWW